MGFETFLTESTVQDVLNEPKIFVMIIGGVASGKSYIYEKNFKSLPLVDIDEYTKKLSNGDWEKARKFVAKAMQMVKVDLLNYFKKGESVVNTGTGGRINGVQHKLKAAVAEGFKTCIVLVDVPEEKALERNKSRSELGDRNLIPDYKVISSNKSARDNFKVFKKETDYSIRIKT